MLKLNISCTRFEVIIVVVQVGALNISYFRQQEIGGENRMKLSLPKQWCISEFHNPPPSPVTELRVLSGAVFF
jgi:hypothetical protein